MVITINNLPCLFSWKTGMGVFRYGTCGRRASLDLAISWELRGSPRTSWKVQLKFKDLILLRNLIFSVVFFCRRCLKTRIALLPNDHIQVFLLAYSSNQNLFSAFLPVILCMALFGHLESRFQFILRSLFHFELIYVLSHYNLISSMKFLNKFENRIKHVMWFIINIKIGANGLFLARLAMLKASKLRKLDHLKAIAELDKAKNLLQDTIRFVSSIWATLLSYLKATMISHYICFSLVFPLKHCGCSVSGQNLGFGYLNW